VLSGDDTNDLSNVNRALDSYRAQYRAAALDGDQPLSQLASSTKSSTWHTLAESKGVLLLDALRREMGDDAFYAFMREFYATNTTKTALATAFIAAAGADRRALFAKWLDSTGLPEKADGPLYTAGAWRSHLASAIIVYGTLAEAGANRYAAEQWQQHFLGMFESEVPVRKDFEVSETELAQHDILFVGRPETNSALAKWAKQIELDYDGSVFQLAGTDHASETDAVVWTATNPLDRKHMVMVAAGNSPLSTVLLTRGDAGQYQYQISAAGHAVESGFVKQ
jgi:hypothetical protein